MHLTDRRVLLVFNDLFALHEYAVGYAVYVRVLNYVFQERCPTGCNKKWEI